MTNYQIQTQAQKDMKTKVAVSIFTIIIGLAATLFAADKLPRGVRGTTCSLKSNGVVVAELWIPATEKSTVKVIGGRSYGSMGGYMTTKGGPIVEIETTGGAPIIIKADEIELSPPE